MIQLVIKLISETFKSPLPKNMVVNQSMSNFLKDPLAPDSEST